ncbi:MAG: TolC family protein [Deltaproteobacteria bacterium]|nr:TolC family protein [Deltaproteobacteria bacterium]
MPSPRPTPTAAVALLLAFGTPFALGAEEPSPQAPPAADAATTLSLADLLQSTARHNPLLTASRHDVEVAEAEQESVAGRSLPTVSALLFGGPTPAAHGDAVTSTTPVSDYGYVLQNLGPFFRAELTITEPLYTFGKLTAAHRAAAELVGVREAQAVVAKWTAVTEVKSVYYGLVLCAELLQLVDEIQAHVDQAETYLEEHLHSDDGEVTPIDRAKLNAYEAELKTQRIDVVKRHAELADALARLAGLEPGTHLRLADRALTKVALPAAALVGAAAAAVDSHPELRAVDAGVRALTLKREAVQKTYWPDLFLAARARYGVAPGRDQQASPFAKDDFNFLDAGVALGLRYEWLTGVTGAEVAKVSAELLALQDRRQALALRVAHEIQTATAAVGAAGAKIEIGEDGFRAARAWSLFAQNGFELGTVSAKDLIDALGAFVKARFTLLSHTYEYNLAVARLSQATGHELLPELATGVW